MLRFLIQNGATMDTPKFHFAYAIKHTNVSILNCSIGAAPDLLDFNEKCYLYFKRICRCYVSIRFYRLWWTDTLDNVRFIFNAPSRYGLRMSQLYLCVSQWQCIIFQLCFRCFHLRYDKDYGIFFIRSFVLFLLWRSHSNHAICNGGEVSAQSRLARILLWHHTDANAELRNVRMIK